MSCYSVAEEIMSICADYLVADAVAPNWSPLSRSPGNREKHTASAFFGNFEAPECRFWAENIAFSVV
jgi:hypothetical protein